MGMGGGDQPPYETPSIGLPWRILLFAILLFAFSLLVYFGLRFGYETYLKGQSAGLDKQLNQLASQVSEQDQQSFVTFYSQLVNLRGLLAEHTYGTKAFDFLEQYTLPQVYFTSAKVGSADGKVELQGIADSLNGFVSQLATFDAAPGLSQKAVVDQMSLTGQTVGFTVTLFMSTSTLAKP